MSRETDNQERQTVRALLPTVSPDTDKLLREIRGFLYGTGVVFFIVSGIVLGMLSRIASFLERLIEAQAP